MTWHIEFHGDFEREYDWLDEDVQDALAAAVALLHDYGPQLGRPHVDTLKGSRHTNMKEIRFSAANGVWRIAFAFDPIWNGIILVAGDKTGVSESRFYNRLIALADARYAAHLKSMGRLGRH